ncbi:LysR substrate-binding domain-containing protein [Hoeflea prorocentri]|uniref:LysR substrate-binding domain-containing protein n=1 Tax=Hoeflea prorocentri TaxID=1922333 RepID=A0A9X3UEW5_9HYPH|nr:LysR substrate-binding domain-containing protein [Hoeflea prorocentri]MCY6380118.1 LysR substrate-binding domain-containing protein [Hoeflea prorocentri]MDA5397918.1 LysR substrate-binding domain-containing protein [Hoeflea prorocentri]
MHRMPPLNWLRTFEASARHLSFTHAAKELGLSQVAVSKQVKQLELHIREPLFVRHARSLEMTKAAEAYLPKVRDAFERLSDGTKEVFGGRRSKVLTLRAATGFSVNWLVPRLPDFYARYPDIPIRIVSSVWNEEIGNPDFDLDIRYGTGKWPGVNTDRLTWDTISPVCSPLIVEGGELTHVDDLKNCTLIHVLGYEEGWAKWLRAAGAADVVDAGRGVQVDNSLVAFELAARGCGVALARSCLVDPMFESGRLARPFDLQVPIDEAFHLVSKQTDQEHADGAVLRAWLLEVAERERQ